MPSRNPIHALRTHHARNKRITPLPTISAHTHHTLSTGLSVWDDVSLPQSTPTVLPDRASTPSTPISPWRAADLPTCHDEPFENAMPFRRRTSLWQEVAGLLTNAFASVGRGILYVGTVHSLAWASSVGAKGFRQPFGMG